MSNTRVYEKKVFLNFMIEAYRCFSITTVAEDIRNLCVYISQTERYVSKILTLLSTMLKFYSVRSS
jgi:hypothetical protein